jgi:hypothetical protein
VASECCAARRGDRLEPGRVVRAVCCRPPLAECAQELDMPHARNVEGPTYSYSGGGSAKGGGTEPEERGAAAASGISLHVAPGHLFAGAAGTTRTEKMPSDGAGFVLSVEGCPSVRLLLVFCCVELENAFVFRFGDSVNAADALSESTDSLCLLMAVRMLMILTVYVVGYETPHPLAHADCGGRCATWTSTGPGPGHHTTCTSVR